MRVIVALLFVCALVLAAGCAKRQSSASAPLAPAQCVIAAAPDRVDGAVTVALLSPVDPGFAPWARNGSERFLFHQLYETLITRDCTGAVVPGLAESWERHDGGRRWTFVLRKGARFSDGSRVTAQDVLDSWQRSGVEPLTFYAQVVDAQADGDRVLDIYFKYDQKEVPMALSSPALAVTKPGAGGWPLGSGRYMMGDAAMTALATDGEAPDLRFVRAAPREARDLLEGRVDMLVTRDPAIVDYADGRDEIETIALPWDVTYLLLAPARAQAVVRGADLPVIPRDVLDALARDAVTAEARGFASKAWWHDLDGCGDLADAFEHWSPRISATLSRQVLYDSSDPIARDLARRVVSLSAMDPDASAEAAALLAAVPDGGEGGRLAARGMSANDLATRLWDGKDFAYIVAVPHRPADRCYAGRSLTHRAPWLTVAEDEFGEAIVPLVDARRYVVARRARLGLSVDWLGNVLVTGGPR